MYFLLLYFAHSLTHSLTRSTSRSSSISVLLIDKNMRIGDETSSRNSEVVHAGLYYPSDSLKERLCLRGKHLLYEYCRRHGVKYRMCGKWIVAAGNHGTNNDRGIGSTITTPSAYEEAYMAQLERKALALDIPLHRISQREIHALEPHLRVSAALSSPTSGIVDSHGLMQALEGELLAGRAGRESHIALQHRLVSVRRLDAAEALEGFRYEALVEDGHVKNGNANARSGNANAKSENTKSGNIQTITAATTSPTLLRIRARTVINSGGLWADDVAAMLKCEDGMKALLPQEVLDNYRTYPCRGHYYTYVNDDAHRRDGTSSTLLQQRQPQHNQMQSQHQHQHPRPLVSRLIYPLPPDPNLTHGLGIHCTVDLAGRLRLGPDADYECASKSDYRVDEEGTVEERARRERFWRAVERYLDIGDLERDGARMRVDYVGIRYGRFRWLDKHPRCMTRLN